MKMEKKMGTGLFEGDVQFWGFVFQSPLFLARRRMGFGIEWLQVGACRLTLQVRCLCCLSTSGQVTRDPQLNSSGLVC